MKADERHKLKANQLLDFMRDLPEKLRQYQRHLIVAGVIVVLAALVGVFVSYQHSVQAEQAWNDLDIAKMSLAKAMAKPEQLPAAADQFGQVASAYPNNPPVTALAYYYKGQAYMIDAGATGMAANANRFSELLRKAEEAFNQVLAQKYHPFATPAANLELGNIAKDRGKFDDARKFYDQARTDPKASAELQDLAAQRRKEVLDKPEQIVFAPPPVTTSAEVEIPMSEKLGPIVQPSDRFTPPSGTVKLPEKPNTGEPAKPAGPATQPH